MPFRLSRRLRRTLCTTLLLVLALLAAQVPFPNPLHVPAALADDDGGDGGDGGGGGDDDGGGNGGDGHSGGDDAGGMSADDHDDDDDDDHDYAWRERRRGTLRSLRSILNRARMRHGGHVLDVKLRRKKRRAWYEIRILDRRDRVRVLRVPAMRKWQNFNIRRR